MNIRPAQFIDLPQIVQIYNHAVEQRGSTADLTPVKVEDRIEWFEKHTENTFPLWVADDGENILGWCSLSPYRPGRMALRHTAEISYYVHRDHRAKGICTALMNHAMSQCNRLGIKSLFALLLDINKASINILEKQGFVRWGHMPGIAEMDGIICGHFIYGRRVAE